MKLYATVSNEKGKEQGMGGSEYVNISFRVKNQKIGDIELYLFDDDVRHGSDENEWLLRFWKNPEDDPIILAQGHIMSTLKQKGKKQKGKCIDCDKIALLSDIERCPPCTENWVKY